MRVIAFDILLAIFRVRSLDPTQQRPAYDLEGREHVAKVVEQLRAYWKANAARSRDERTIRVLANSKADPGACRTAADALTGKFNGYRGRGPLGIHLRPSDEPPLDPRRTGKGGMYLTPTEAVLAALDREIAAVRANPTLWHRPGAFRDRSDRASISCARSSTCTINKVRPSLTGVTRPPGRYMTEWFGRSPPMAPEILGP